MVNRINKCNMSISTLLFFFSIYSSGTQELHRKSGNHSRRKNAFNFVVPIQHIITLVISLALCEGKDTVRETEYNCFHFQFHFQRGATELVFEGNLSTYVLNYQNILHTCL